MKAHGGPGQGSHWECVTPVKDAGIAGGKSCWVLLLHFSPVEEPVAKGIFSSLCVPFLEMGCHEKMEQFFIFSKRSFSFVL